jgi:hypothetical protein
LVGYTALASGLVFFKDQIMFISNKEKIDLKARVEVLEMRVDQLARSLNALHDNQTMVSELKANQLKRSTTGWTPEARAIHGERIRLMWAEKRAAKVKT